MRAQMSNHELFTGPSIVGPLLLQQQGHPVVYAELIYRHYNSSYRVGCSDCQQNLANVLGQYSSLLQETAEFMASFALHANGAAVQNDTSIP